MGQRTDRIFGAKPMIPHESALFLGSCKPSSLVGRTMSGHREGVCTSGNMGGVLVRGSTKDIRRG
jgi:hypothetical protein